MTTRPRGYSETCEICTFPEVLIGDDAPAVLKPGMRVLAPCQVCGAPPIEELDFLGSTLDATAKAFTALLIDRDMVLYHWAPTTRRKQIIRSGLRPAMRPTTHADLAWRAPYLCLADTPKWAWLLSGGQASAPTGQWDLWETWAGDVTEPYVMPGDNRNGIHEVRTHHRIFKRHLWRVATRTKP